jgi:hypothetical protein
MPRFNRSQFNSKIRQAQQKQRQAINDYNREVRRVNAHNKRVIDNYNREVRAHNQRVRANRQRLQRELARLGSRRTTTTRYITYQTSVQTLQRSFVRVEESSERQTWSASDDLFEMAEGETANSVAVLNALLDEPTAETGDAARLNQTVITTELAEIHPDLDAGWRGALFALSPTNPDAARQFCTSAREIFVKILDLKAPNEAVLAANANIQLTQHGQIPRREKIHYCLAQSGQQDETLVDFVEDDINNVMDLFGVFNPATHGEAGKYDITQLQAIKTRVEGAIQFLHRIVSYKMTTKTSHEGKLAGQS